MNGLLVLLLVVPSILCANIHLLDITPEEAQRLITQQSLDLRYASKLGEMPLSLARNYNGDEKKVYYNGKVIDNTDDYVEETYEANQFHGQDGLGRYMFGYTDHNQARIEAKNVNGDVRGSYKYALPDGEEYQVNYWSDSLGFHQTDNREVELPQQVTDTPEVRAAREAHLAAWEEAARAAAVDPDPMSDVYNRNGNKFDQEYQDDPDQELEGQVSNQQQSLARFPNLPYTKHISPNDFHGEATDTDSVVIDAPINLDSQPRASAPKVRQVAQEEEEVTREPRGFFYSFDYPVHLIVENERKRSLNLEQAQAGTEQQIRFLKPAFDEKEDKPIARVSEGIRDGTLDEPVQVHDAQAHPKQKNLKN